MSETEAIEKRKPGRIALDPKNTLHYKAIKEAGGMKQFLDFLGCSLSDPRAPIFVEKWKKRNNRGAVQTLDDLCAKMQLDPALVFSWASEGAYRQTQQVARFHMALAAPDVVGKNVEFAKTDKGFKDRNLFFQATGLRPTATGTHIRVEQSNVNTANAAAKGGDTALPDFASQRRQLAEIARSEE